MPLEIVSKEYRNRDLIGGPLPLLNIPYAPIYMFGYGRVNAQSPVAGLVTFAVTSCTAVVIHSPDTKRTVLTHSPNYMLMDLTFIPIVEWIIGKGEDVYNPKSSIEAVILRGSDYNLPNSFNRAHPGWVQDFKDMLKHFSTHPSHVFDDQPLDQSSYGTVYVDKISGKITRVSCPEISKSGKILQVVNKDMSQVYTMQQRLCDLYVGNVIQKILELDLELWPTLHLQYNVNKYMAAIIMPDIARLSIRAKMLNKPLPHWPLSKRLHVEVLMNNMLGDVAKLGLPCERCDMPGAKKCQGCLGAYYCSKEHQIEDWKAHKKFCKNNKVE